MLHRTNSKELPPCRRLPLRPSRIGVLRPAQTTLWRFPARVRTGPRAPFLPRRPAGRSGLMTACALLGAALSVFARRETHNAYVGAAYILWMAFGVWRSGSGNEDSCTRQRPFRGCCCNSSTPKASLWIRLRPFVLPLRFLYGFGCFHRRALGRRLRRDMFLGAGEPIFAVFQNRTMPPPTRAWRPPVVLAASCMLNYLSRDVIRPWAHVSI